MNTQEVARLGEAIRLAMTERQTPAGIAVAVDAAIVAPLRERITRLEGETRGHMEHAASLLRRLRDEVRETWSAEVPPGGMVCAVCGEPVESEPCPEHHPRLVAERLRAEVERLMLGESERAMLRFALDLAADQIASRGNEFTHEDRAALESLRACATEAERAPAPTMTVRVCDRGTGRDYVGVTIRTVTISARCPRCGGPRGVDSDGNTTVKNHNFHEDGEWLSVDRWTNPCGHGDMYAAVLAEVRAAEAAAAETGGAS